MYRPQRARLTELLSSSQWSQLCIKAWADAHLRIGPTSPVPDTRSLGGPAGDEGDAERAGRPQGQARQLLQSPHDEWHHKSAHLWRWALWHAQARCMSVPAVHAE